MIAQSPDERVVYEARLKFQRDAAARLEYALLQGRAEGRAEGKIRTLQQLLGLTESTDEDLSQMDLAALEAMAAELQAEHPARGLWIVDHRTELIPRGGSGRVWRGTLTQVLPQCLVLRFDSLVAVGPIVVEEGDVLGIERFESQVAGLFEPGFDATTQFPFVRSKVGIRREVVEFVRVGFGIVTFFLRHRVEQ